ncbi:MAG TPA: prolipoprotein diacylglyceryl transferase [Tenericutes bacterium]|nr:prolipoprotein diacylglyceryl transferase [Mycoplasmatota bacterium]
MDPILLDLGYIQIHWYSIFLFIAFLIGGTIILKEAERFKIPEDFMINYFFFLLPFSIIGARLYYVIFNWDYYSLYKSEIFKIWEGGLAIHGGILFGLIWTIIYCTKWKVSKLRMLDILVVGLIIGQAIGRWGNFFNQEAYGNETTFQFLKSLYLPKFIIEGMNINGIYYHPTFLYESLFCLIGFIILLIVRRGKYIKIGQITAIYLIWYGIGRFFIESLRTDSLMFNDFRIARIVSILMFIIGVLMFIVRGSKSRFEDRYNDMENIDEIIY